MCVCGCVCVCVCVCIYVGDDVYTHVCRQHQTRQHALHVQQQQRQHEAGVQVQLEQVSAALAIGPMSGGPPSFLHPPNGARWIQRVMLMKNSLMRRCLLST